MGDLNRSSWKWRNVCSLYVANLPQGINVFKVRDLFKCYGKIVDVYIPMKPKIGNSCCYAFVRFESWDEGLRAIEYLDRWSFLGNCLTVRMANQFGMGGQSGKAIFDDNAKKVKSMRELDVDKGGKAYMGYPFNKNDSSKETSVWSIEVWKGSEELKWLEGCALAEIADWNLNLTDIVRGLDEENINNCEVIYLGGFLYLLQFLNSVVRDITIQEFEDMFSNLFSSVRPWSEHEGSNRKLVWIRCFGISLHIWNEVFFNQISALFGSLIKLDQDTVKKKNLEYGRMLILSSVVDVIRRKVNIKVDDSVHQIYLCEESNEVKLGTDCGDSKDSTAAVNKNREFSNIIEVSSENEAMMISVTDGGDLGVRIK